MSIFVGTSVPRLMVSVLFTTPAAGYNDTTGYVVHTNKSTALVEIFVVELVAVSNRSNEK